MQMPWGPPPLSHAWGPNPGDSGDQSTVDPGIDAFDFLSRPSTQIQMPLDEPLPRSDTAPPNRIGTGGQSIFYPSIDASEFSSRPRGKRQMPFGPRRRSDTKRPNCGDTGEQSAVNLDNGPDA
jgi:hypothetical protein